MLSLSYTVNNANFLFFILGWDVVERLEDYVINETKWKNFGNEAVVYFHKYVKNILLED